MTENFTFGNIQESWGDAFGYTLKLFCMKSPSKQIFNVHQYGWWGSHRMEWFGQNGESQGTEIDLSEIEANFDENNISSYQVECSHFSMHSWISYNSSKYNSLGEAWDADEAKILFAIGFDEIGTGWSAWSLISKVLFFDMPDIHPILNYIIALPIWIAIAWLVFAFIIAVVKALPFT